MHVRLVICVLESPFLLIRADDSTTKHYYNDDNIDKIENRIFATPTSLLRNALQFIVTSHYRHRDIAPLLYRHCTIS